MIFGVVFDISSLRMSIRMSVSDVDLEAVEAVLDVEKVKISKFSDRKLG